MQRFQAIAAVFQSNLRAKLQEPLATSKQNAFLASKGKVSLEADKKKYVQKIF